MMKHSISKLATGLIFLYLLAALVVFTPYYNWKYAQSNGFVSWLLLGEFVATAKAFAWPYFLLTSNSQLQEDDSAEVKIVEYTDHEYGFAFLFPSDWKMVPLPQKGEAGEVRVAIKSPKSTMLIVIVGDFGKSLSKENFDRNPNSSAIVDDLINHTVDSLYKKTSKDLNATRMIVEAQRAIPSEVAIAFYINTMHLIKTNSAEIPMIVSGLHYIPFGKSQMISLIMTATVDKNAKEENEAYKNILNSFHLMGEKPL
jgi:hypothetical protein